MDFNSALDIIIKDLEEARSIIDDLKKYKGVPMLQAELAKAKCRSAAEIIALLKELPQPALPDTEVSVKEKALAEEKQVAAVSAEEKLLIAEKQMAEVVSAHDEEQKPPVADIEPATVTKLEEIVSAGATETNDIIDVRTTSPKSKHASRGIIADRFGEVAGRINEKVQAVRPEEDLTSRLQQSPILNLADAIGINDRFYFVREVFGGDNSRYLEAIGNLNKVSAISEAREILSRYTDGTANSMAVNDLLTLVKRKTGSDE
jgi:hypothetical protein